MAEEDFSKQEEGDTGSVSCGCFLGSKGYGILHSDEEGNRQRPVGAKWFEFKNFLRYKLVKFRIINKKPTKLPFRYDPKSYALNFDDGGSPTNPPVVVTNLEAN